jgi:4-hydroxy-4-methyl-2-oxoglutarate aldolase
MKNTKASAAGLDTNLIEYLQTVDTPTLSNAVELLQVRANNEGFASLEIRCFFPELPRLCGYAVTAQVETMSKAERIDIDAFIRLYKAVEDSPKPAVIVFQEIGPQPEYAAHCGEGMATTFRRLGAVGLVSDSGVRDIPEVRAIGFQYFARGAVASHGYFRIARVSAPVHVLGLPIRPQDLLHGDENGLIVVPKKGLEKLPSLVDAVRTRESQIFEFIRGPHFSLDKLRRRIVQ